MAQGIVSAINTLLAFWQQAFLDIQYWLTADPTSGDVMGGVWSTIEAINAGISGVAYGLLLTFFLITFFKDVGNVSEVQPKQIFWWCCRFVIAKVIVDFSIDLMVLMIQLTLGINDIILSFDPGTMQLPSSAELQTLADAIGQQDFLAQLQMFFGGLINYMLIGVCFIISFIGIIITMVVVYLRFFKVYIFAAIAPIPLSTIANPEFKRVGWGFIKNFAGVCLEICVIALVVIIFKAIATDNTLMFSSWESVSVGNEAVSEFFGLLNNFALTFTVKVCLLVAAVIAAPRIISKILGS